jgi:hypothetical protein
MKKVVTDAFIACKMDAAVVAANPAVELNVTTVEAYIKLTEL